MEFERNRRIESAALSEGKTKENQLEEDSYTLSQWVKNNPTLRISLIAILSALGPALSISFIWFPYFELLSFTIFISGIILGTKDGLIVGFISSVIYEVLSTVIMGFALVIYPFKLLGFLLIAVVGGLIGKSNSNKKQISWNFFIAILGGLLTIFYDLLTNLGYLFFTNFQFNSFLSLLVTSLPVTAIRVITNSILFFFIPMLLSRVFLPMLKQEGN
ncbi:MAG: ECF transporter S component [Asgard group archaeon]|nr:ECF transporter S component [Asgard group archaeon]